jgi:hypothetical protein
MKVHTALGNGFQEVIYQRSLEVEMNIKESCSKEKKKCLYFIVIC